MTLSSELRAWLVPGLVGVIAAADSRQQPQIARVWAFRVISQERDVIDVYVPCAASPTLLEALANGSRAALNLIELPSYRSRLFKGPCEVSRAVPEPAFLDEHVAAYDRALCSVGMPPGSAERMLSHSDAPRDMVALSLTVESVF
ncbi:MAG TPA: hypothetical protein VGP93_12050, partial [Polyangiaceae bacterium]|nr:hypothetical protein [Polyangiaceae bacterium]